MFFYIITLFFISGQDIVVWDEKIIIYLILYYKFIYFLGPDIIVCDEVIIYFSNYFLLQLYFKGLDIVVCNVEIYIFVILYYKYNYLFLRSGHSSMWWRPQVEELRFEYFENNEQNKK